MAIKIDESVKPHLLLHAASLAGPAASSAEINAQIDRLVGIIAPGGAASKHLDYKLEHYESTVSEVKTFVGTIVNVDKEASSNRGVVFFHTPPNDSRFYQEFEAVRTDITKDNPTAQALANQAVQLVGHKVVVTVRIEVTKTQNKVRVLENLEDRGIDTGDLPEFTIEAWDAMPKSSPKSDRLVNGSQGRFLPLPEREGAAA